MAIIDELIAILGYDIQGEGNLKRFNAGIDAAEQHARGAARGIGVLGVAVGSFIGSMAAMATAKIASTIGGLPGEIISVGSTFEKLETTLTTIEGSSDKAKTSLAWVQDFAARTPYDMNQVAESFVRLRAYGLDPMNGLLESIGNASSAMGKGVMQGVEAVADAAQGENERLKEFGIRAKAEGDKMTYSWQENGQEMSKTVKKSGSEIVKALMEIFGRFDGAMEAQSKTWEGMTSNLGDTWTGFLKKISEAGYYEETKRRLRGVMDQIDKWERDGTIDKVAKAISDAFVFAIRTAVRFGGHLYTIGRAAYYAGAAIVSLISRLTGLSTELSAGLFGAGLLASTAMGRAALLAIAKRVPIVAAALLIDDILTGLNNPADSYIGSLKGGAEAFASVKASWDQLSDAATKLSDSLTKLFGGDVKTNLPKPTWHEWIDNELLAFMRDLNKLIGEITTGVNAVNFAISNPKEAWAKFVDVIIEELDRLLRAVDEKLGGALSRLGIIKNPDVPEDHAVTKHQPILNTEEYVSDDPTRTVMPEGGRQGGFITDTPREVQRDIMDADARDLAWQMQQEEAARVANAPAPGIISRTIDTVSSAINAAVYKFSTSLDAAKKQLELSAEDRLTREPTPMTSEQRVSAAAETNAGLGALKQMMQTANDNLARMVPDNAVQATVTDARQDNRQFPMNVSTNITQNIQQATQAPAAAAQATGQAVNSAVAGQAARIEQEPAF